MIGEKLIRAQRLLHHLAEEAKTARDDGGGGAASLHGRKELPGAGQKGHLLGQFGQRLLWNAFQLLHPGVKRLFEIDLAGHRLARYLRDLIAQSDPAGQFVQQFLLDQGGFHVRH